MSWPKPSRFDRARSEALYLADIRDAIDRILGYTVTGRDALFGDRKTQDAVVRNIEIIGEAVRGISQKTREAHADVPWKDMARMRDRVIHHYFRVDLDVVWDVITNDLSSLREQITALLRG